MIPDKWDRRKRHPSVAKTKFEYWVYSSGGPIPVGKLLGVHPETIRNWIKRKNQPGLIVILRLLKLAPELTLKDIAKGTLP